ncbi:MAG: DUF6240 domain-containing protein [bacterium]|nr:DUF6240 domain-containing protein [bacterium]
MNRINVNTVSTKDACYLATEEAANEQFVKGQVVEGVITKVSDKISITLNGKELQVSQSAVQDAKEGQVKTFEITDISNKSIVLREVGNETEQVSSQGVKQTSIVMSKASFVGKLEDTKTKQSVNETKNQVNKQITSTLNRLSEEDYKVLSEQQTPMEEYEEDRLERAIDRIKEQRQFKEEHLESAVEKKEEAREDLREGNSSIEKKLAEQNLPVTDANIAKVSTAMELITMAPQMTDSSKAYLIDQSMAVTPENIYKSIYSGMGSRGQASLAETTWNELKPQVEELLQKDGINVTTDTLNEAKWLISNNLTVSKESISTLEQLNNLQQNMDQDLMMKLCLNGLSQGTEPKQTDLTEQMEELDCRQKAMESIKLLESIEDDAVNHIAAGKAVTLQSLSSASNGLAVDGNEIKAITARRQLEEVRLKLTMESSYQLYKQGIQVDTTELEQLVGQLRALEDSYYQGIARDLGVMANEEELTVLKATDQVVNGLKNIPGSVLGSTYEKRAVITMAELYETGEEERNKPFNRTNEYETLMTAPRKDLGDSIQKAFSNVDAILDELSLEHTKSNHRAVRILAYNQMEITKESITNMKSYDLEVNQLFEQLTPEVALTLIKQGENPLSMPISTLNDKVNEIASSLDVTSEEKFSEFLYNLDKKNALTTDERESYIGIYRLLHQVEKSDGAAVGAVVKADQELTLNNLLTAVRSNKKTGMDIEVNEAFGGVERINPKGTSISDQVNKAFYASKLASQVFDDLTVDAVITLDQKHDELLDVTLEQFYETEQEVNRTTINEYSSMKYEQVRDVLSQAKTDVLVAAEIPVSVNNIQAVNYVASEATTFYKDMKQKAAKVSEELAEQIHNVYNEFAGNFENEEEVQQSFDKLVDTMNQVFEEYMKQDQVTSKDMEELRLYKNSIRLASQMSRSQMFELPVNVGDNVVNLKVQMVPSTDGQTKVAIHMSEEAFGTLDVTATVQGNELSAFVVCDNRKVVEYFNANTEEVTKELEQSEVNVKQLIVTMNRKQTEFYDTSSIQEGTVTTKSLYRIAKIFVSFTKKAYEQ